MAFIENKVIPYWINQSFIDLTESPFTKKNTHSNFAFFSESSMNGGTFMVQGMAKEMKVGDEFKVTTPNGQCGILYRGSFTQDGRTYNNGIYSALFPDYLFLGKVPRESVGSLVIASTTNNTDPLNSVSACVIGKTNEGNIKVLIATYGGYRGFQVVLYEYNGDICTGYAVVEDSKSIAVTDSAPAIVNSRAYGTLIAWKTKEQSPKICYTKIQENSQQVFSNFEPVDPSDNRADANSAPTLAPVVVKWTKGQKIENVLCAYTAAPLGEHKNNTIQISYIDPRQGKFRYEYVLPTDQNCIGKPLIANGIVGKVVYQMNETPNPDPIPDPDEKPKPFHPIKPYPKPYDWSLDTNFEMETSYVICMWTNWDNQICWAYSPIVYNENTQQIIFRWGETSILSTQDVTGVVGKDSAEPFVGTLINLVTEGMNVYGVTEDKQGKQYKFQFNVESNQPGGIPGVITFTDVNPHNQAKEFLKIHIAYRTSATSQIAVKESNDSAYTTWSDAKLLSLYSLTGPTLFKNYDGSIGLLFTDIKDGILKFILRKVTYTMNKKTDAYEKKVIWDTNKVFPILNAKTDLPPAVTYYNGNPVFLYKKLNSPFLTIISSDQGVYKPYDIPQDIQTSGMPAITLLQNGEIQRLVIVYRGRDNDTLMYYSINAQLKDSNWANNWSTHYPYNRNNTTTNGPSIANLNEQVAVLFKGVPISNSKIYMFTDSKACWGTSGHASNTPVIFLIGQAVHSISIYNNKLYYY